MRWPFGKRNKGTREPPAGRAPVGAGSLETTRSLGDPPGARPGPWERSEATVINDGQLGGANLQRGPERRNPEGSVDISNADFWRRS